MNCGSRSLKRSKPTTRSGTLRMSGRPRVPIRGRSRKSVGKLIYYHNISDEIDRISFELELEDTDDEEQFGFEDDDDDDDNDDIFDGYDEDIDPAIFDNPTLMVKWLEQQEKQNTVFVEGSQRHKQEHLEAERREQEHLEAVRREQERLEAERELERTITI